MVTPQIRDLDHWQKLGPVTLAQSYLLAHDSVGCPIANANLCGLREANDGRLQGTGHGGRRFPSCALDWAAQHHGRECCGGLRGRWLLLALLDEGRGVGRQLSQGGQAPLGTKTDAGSTAG